MGKTYTVKQVADILGYSTNSVYTFLKEGKIKGVRIGKGRFRITHEELGQLFKSEKSQSVVPDNISIPSLFDWFVSLLAIVLGLTMILFVCNFEEFSEAISPEFLLSIKINFLVAGLGLFTVNLFNRSRKRAFFIFYFIVLINYLAFSLFLFLGNDIMGSLFFILTAATIIFHLIFNLKGTISFSVLITLITILSSIVMIFFPSIIDLSEISKGTGLEQNLAIMFWSVLVVIINSFIWFLKKKKSFIYWLSFTIISIGLGYFAYLYSTQLYWSRALIYILLILFLFISSFWETIEQKIIVRIFINLALIFSVTICSIWVFQNNIHVYVQNEMINELAYGNNLTELMLATSQDKLEILSKNKKILDAIKKKDNVALSELIKDVYLYSSTFRRVLVADEKGDLLTNYPFTNVDYTNIAFRDYFKKVQAEKKSYLSNIFQSSANGQKRYVVSINVPILDEQNVFRGILIGSFDMDSLANKLQLIGNMKDGEYFILVDRIGNLIISPESVNKLDKSEVDDLVHNVTKGINVEETLDMENKLLQVHDKVNDKDWTIAIRRPLSNTYNFDRWTNALIVICLIGFSLSIIYLNIFHLNE